MARLNASSKTSDKVGWVCTLKDNLLTDCLLAIAFAASWIKSEAWRPIICTPNNSPVSWR